jgi:hypothetical protein
MNVFSLQLIRQSLLETGKFLSDMRDFHAYRGEFHGKDPNEIVLIHLEFIDPVIERIPADFQKTRRFGFLSP